MEKTEKLLFLVFALAALALRSILISSLDLPSCILPDCAGFSGVLLKFDEDRSFVLSLICNFSISIISFSFASFTLRRKKRKLFSGKKCDY